METLRIFFLLVFSFAPGARRRGLPARRARRGPLGLLPARRLDRRLAEGPQAAVFQPRCERTPGRRGEAAGAAAAVGRRAGGGGGGA